MPTSRVTIDSAAKALLSEMAAAEDTTPRAYIEALVNYATSCHRRPGSWEADKPFAFGNYDDRRESAVGERWF